MLDDEAIRAAARQLMTARAARAPYQPLETGRHGAPLEDAYRIQDALHELVTAEGGGALAGYKIALTSKAMQEMVGVDQPLAGAVFASAVHRAPARVSLAPFQHLGVEFEVAVQLGADLPPAAARPYARQRGGGGGGLHARLRARGGSARGLPDHRRLQPGRRELLERGRGPRARLFGDWRRLSLEAAPTRLWINEAPAGEGRAGDALGHPFEAVAWLANLLNRRGRLLRRDMFVMTGSSITTKFPAAGDRLRFAIDGLGEVTLELTA